jgi:hypothetical protein
MADLPLPGHVLLSRRDGRREVLLHRSVAIIGPDRVEIKAARSAALLPFIGLVVTAGIIATIALTGGSLPLWLMVVLLFFCILVVPASVMGLVGAVAGADVIVDAKKGSATWQQGYLGMGIGTKEFVPFGKIAHLEVGIEGDQPDRWHEHTDDLRQFSLTLVKQSGKRLTMAQVPVPAYGQVDGMDRTLAVGHAIAALTGSDVRIPEGWQLVEVDADTGAEPGPPNVAAPEAAPPKRTRRRRPRHG